MRMFLAVLLALSASLAGAADTAAEWLDTASNPALPLREREYAARQVLMLADPSASILIAALRGEGSDSGLRQQVAAGILGELGSAAAEEALLEAAFDNNYFIAEAAAGALARLYARRSGGELVRLLERGMPGPEDAGGTGDDWWQVRMHSERSRERFRGLVLRGAARKYAGTAEAMPPELTEAVWDGLLNPDAECRLSAVRLTPLTGDSRAGAKLAAFLAAENNAKLLAAGLRAMSAMRPAEYGAAAERHARHADPLVALEALGALDALGYPGALFPAEPGARAAGTFITHPSTPVRRRAAEILAAGKDPAALPFLQRALMDRVPQNRAAAARLLGEMGLPGAAGALNPLTADSHPEVRSEAAAALARFGVVGVTARVLEDLASGAAPFRRAAAEALGRMGDSRAAPALAAVLDDEDPELVCAAAEALGRLKAETEGKTLYRLMTETQAEWVADTARRALLDIYGDDPGMSPVFWESWARRKGLE